MLLNENRAGTNLKINIRRPCSRSFNFFKLSGGLSIPPPYGKDSLIHPHQQSRHNGNFFATHINVADPLPELVGWDLGRCESNLTMDMDNAESLLAVVGEGVHGLPVAVSCFLLACLGRKRVATRPTIPTNPIISSARPRARLRAAALILTTSSTTASG